MSMEEIDVGMRVLIKYTIDWNVFWTEPVTKYTSEWNVFWT